MNSKIESIILCVVMVASVSAPITQDVGEPDSSSSGGGGGLADSPWPMFRGNPKHTGLSQYDTSGNIGQLKWSFTTGDNVRSSPAIGSDGTIYVGSRDNKLYAINPDGTEEWNFITGGHVDSSPAIGSEGTIYFGSKDNNLYAINPDGTKKWSFTTDWEVNSSPAIGSDGTIYIGSFDRNLYAINSNGIEKWRFTTGGALRTSPAIGSDGTIYIGSYDHKLYAINPDGTMKWSFTAIDSLSASSPAIGPDGTIYVGSDDHRLYAINPDGTKKWDFITNDDVNSSPAIGSDGTIYFGSDDRHLYALNPDGTEKWSFTIAEKRLWYSSPAIGSDGTIYVGYDTNRLYAISPDGSEKWNFITGDGIRSSPAIGSDGTIYIGCYDGKLYAIGNPSQNLEIKVTSHFTELNSAAQSQITVHVTDGTNPIQGAAVNLASDNGGLFSPQSGITDSNGKFESIFNAPTATTQAICRITAHAGKTGYNDASGYVDITVNPIPWPMFRHNLNHTGLNPYDTSANPGKLKWSFTTGGNVTSSPAIDSDGTIYVGSYDDKLYAINPDGIEKWSFTTGGYVPSSPAIGSDGTIYIGSYDNKLYAINPDGPHNWSYTTGDIVTSSPAIGSDGTIYIGSWDKKLYALNPDGSKKWDFSTGSRRIISSPAIGYDGTVYISSGIKLYAINPDGTEKWSFTTTIYGQSSPAIGSDGTIYVGSYDNKLYAINPNGTQKWNFTTGGYVRSSPAIGSDGTIYVGSDDERLYAINPDGTQKWNFTTGYNVMSSPAIGSDGTIYVGSYDDKLYAINSDGTQKWNFTAGDWIYSSPAIGTDGTIYFGSWDCKLYAIGTPTQIQPPVADAGPDQTVNEGDVVQFDGTGSYDPNSGAGGWVPRANIPSPRSGGGSAVLNNELYYVGGGPGDMGTGISDVFQKYTPAIDSWSDLPSLPQKRTLIGAATVNGKIYAIGGDGGYSTRNTTYVFDPATNSWTEKAPMPIAMAAYGIAVVDDCIYTIGGISTYLNCTWCNIVYQYNTTTDTWSQTSDLPTARGYLAATSLDGKIYAIGGRTWGATCPIEVYDPETDTWTEKTPSLTYRWALCAETLGGKIYVFGGSSGGDLAMNTTEMYDPESDTWTTITPMLDIRQEFGSGVVGNCIYAVGGNRGWMAGYPLNSEKYGLESELTYEWDFDSDVDSNGDGNYTNDVDATGPTPTHVFGDDGIYTVTLTVTSRWETGDVRKDDQDCVLVMDSSGSMDWNDPINLRIEAAKYYVDKLTPDDRACVVDFDTEADLMPPGPYDEHLSMDYARIKNNLGYIDNMGGTGISTGLNLSNEEHRNYGDPINNIPVIILLTDAQNNDPVDNNYCIREAHIAAGRGIKIFTIGLAMTSDSNEERLLKDIANITIGKYFPAPDASYLEEIYKKISEIVENYSAGELFDTDTMQVTVQNVAPTPAPFGPFTADEGSSMAFTFSTEDPGSDDLTFTWNWGDGTSDNVTKYYNNGLSPEPDYDPVPNEIKSPWGAHPFSVTDTMSHTYGDNGFYTITLTATDDDNGISTYTTTITVNNAAPSVNSITAPSGIEGSPITFSSIATDPGSDDLTFTWDWGDGTTATTTTYYNNGVSPDPPQSPWGTYPYTVTDTVQHTYGDNGVYTITLTVTDDDGKTTIITADVVVNNVAPTITLAITPSGDEGSSLTFEAGATDPGSDDLSFSWEFEYGPTIENTYYNNGVSPEPVYDPVTNEIKSPQGTYPFNASDMVTHTYGDNYNYTMVLIVTDDDSAVTTYTTTVSVNNVAPSILELAIPYVAYEGTSATYRATVKDLGSDDLTFKWNFGDSTPVIENKYYNNGTSPDPCPSPNGIFPFIAQDTLDHTYGDNYNYTLTFKVTDDDGGITTLTTTVYVNNVAPTIEPFGPFTVDEGMSLDLTAFSTDLGNDDLTFTWEFGYGPTIINVHYNDGVSPDPYPSPEGNYPFNVTDTVTHTYGDNGVFTVTLTVIDDDNGKTSYTTNITVNNVAPTINPIWPMTLIFEGTPFVLSANSTDQGSDDLTFTWEFELGPTITNIYYNDGTNPDPYPSPWGTYPFSAVDQVSHTYGDNGVYAVTVRVEDDDKGIASFTANITVYNVAPTVEPFGPFTVDEASPLDITTTSTDPGSDDLTFTWEFDYGPTYVSSYYNDGTGPDPYPSPWGTYPISAADNVEHTYGDNGVFNLTLTVEDDDGDSTTFITNITVNNVAPVIEKIEAYVYVNISLRVAGEKYHSVDIHLYEEDTKIWTGKVTRYPGSPDDQKDTIYNVKLDMTKRYSAKVDYLPNDPRINGNVWGGNPVWIEIEFENESTARIHHTFNVRQSYWNSDHWNHIDPWEVGLNPHLVGHNITLEGIATDPGSDDLTFTWAFGDGTTAGPNTYYNNGVSPDPYPSPEINPMNAIDTCVHAYTTSGTYTITLVVEDDDGATTITTLEIGL